MLSLRAHFPLSIPSHSAGAILNIQLLGSELPELLTMDVKASFVLFKVWDHEKHHSHCKGS